jgi:hypothetical protein
MMVIDNEYKIGQVVYLKTDNDQIPRIVTRIFVSISELMYELSCGTVHTEHWGFEMLPEKDLITTL